jgi:raffinose/stachyose/melibiose transport system substrate-binding protein
MRRMWIRCILVLLIAPFANAGGKQEPSAAPQKIVTLRYWGSNNEAEQKTRYDWTYQTVALFQEANPNIKVEYTNVPNGDQYLNKLSTEMAANNVPDLFQCWTAGRLEPFVKAGRVLPLDGIIDSTALKEVVNPGNCSATTFDGKIYAIPMELAGEVVYYNKALFKQVGLEPPATWDELMRAVKAFRSIGINPFSLGNKDPWPGTIPYMAIFDKLNGPEEYKKAMFQKQAVFNTAPYVNAAKYLVELVKARAYPDNFNSLEYAEGIAIFRNRQGAMRYNGTWEVPDHITALGGDLGFMNWVTMPGGKGKRGEGWLTIQNVGMAIGAATAHKAEAAKFLEFFLSKDRMKILAEAGFMVALKNIPFDESKLHPVASGIAKALASSPNPILIWDVVLGQNIGKELNLATQAILGGADIQSTLDNLNKIARSEWAQ